MVFAGFLVAGMIGLAGILIWTALKEFRQDLRYFYPLIQREQVFDERTNGGTEEYDLGVGIPKDWEFWAEKDADREEDR